MAAIESYDEKTKDKLINKMITKWDIQNYATTAREEGFEEGREEGCAEGLDMGIKKGREEGRAEGLDMGIKTGKEEGFEQGIKKGREERISMIKNLLKYGDDELMILSATP